MKKRTTSQYTFLDNEETFAKNGQMKTGFKPTTFEQINMGFARNS